MQVTAQLEKCSRFAELHQQHSAWLIPNPWDVGSARVLQDLGVTRVSTDGASNWAEVNPLITAGKEMLEQRSFSWLTGVAKGTEVQALMKKSPMRLEPDAVTAHSMLPISCISRKSISCKLGLLW